MNKDYLSNLTPEQRLEMREKAKASKAAKNAFAENNLKTSWQDESYWRELASRIGFRLPTSYTPCSETKHLKRLLKVCNIDVKDWAEIEGFKTLKGFSTLNPEIPSFVRCGLVLEYYFENGEGSEKEETKQEGEVTIPSSKTIT